jgi:hypothetical protein
MQSHSSRLPRWLAIGAATVGGLVVLALAAILFFPFGALKGIVEQRLTARFDRPVTIASLERVGGPSFTPTVAIRGLRVPQADWAGTGDFVTIDSARATFSVLPLLIGRFTPRDVSLSGLHLVLVRDAGGRTNWERGQQKKGGSGSNALRGLTIANSVVEYRDGKQDRWVTLNVASDPKTGVRADGRGSVRGAAITVHVAGPSVDANDGKPWPFTAAIEGERLAMQARGTMDTPLDTNAMALDVTARAADLKLIDAVIEAGLFKTRAVTLSAHVRHDRPKWEITKLNGTIGRSQLSGWLNVDKVDGRTKLDGRIASRQLDFNDLSSEEGRAKAAALEARIGPRLVPNTPIDIGKITHTDGTIRFAVDRIVSDEGASSLVALSGTATMDHQLLTIAPFRLQLPRGLVGGRLSVDQRGGRKVPILSVDARLASSIPVAIASGMGSFTGRINAAAHLRGSGETIRQAVGHANGTVGFVARDGTLPKRIADALGFDAGRALLAKSGQSAGLRCVVVRLAVADGTGRVDPLVLDTTQSQMHGRGTIAFPDETIAVTLTGAPKQGAVLRLPGEAYLKGTISSPSIVVPDEVKSAGNIFKAIGRAIKGTQGPTASDADCAALATRALR